MKIRMGLGGLAESMEHAAEIEPTAEAIAEYVSKMLDPEFYATPFTAAQISVKKYGWGIDHRIGWDTHLVTVEGFGTFGYTDGPLPAPATRKGNGS